MISLASAGRRVTLIDGDRQRANFADGLSSRSGLAIAEDELVAA